jgi:hypothetical protein
MRQPIKHIIDPLLSTHNLSHSLCTRSNGLAASYLPFDDAALSDTANHICDWCLHELWLINNEIEGTMPPVGYSRHK